MPSPQKPNTPETTPPTDNPAPVDSQPASSQPSDVPPVTDPPSDGPPPREPKIISMPTRALATIKQEERRREKQRMMKALDTQARAKGYASHADMLSRTPAAGTKAPAAPPAASEAPTATTRRSANTSRLERENARLLEDKRRANRQRAAEERSRKQLERKMNAQSAENTLRISAVRAGVQDVDYAIHLVRKRIEGLSKQELTDFDEDKFFADTLRKSHSYLYTVKTEPASTTPTDGGSNPAPPTPGEPVPPASEEPVDARKLNDEEYNALLRKRGLTPPGAGMLS